MLSNKGSPEICHLHEWQSLPCPRSGGTQVMATLNISLPNGICKWVGIQAGNEYANTSDYIRAGCLRYEHTSHSFFYMLRKDDILIQPWGC